MCSWVALKNNFMCMNYINIKYKASQYGAAMSSESLVVLCHSVVVSLNWENPLNNVVFNTNYRGLTARRRC